MQQNAGNPAVHLLLGQAFAQQDDYGGALAELNSALQLDPRLPEAHFYMGLIHIRQGDFDSAAAEFRAELEIRPADTVANYHLGYVLFQQGHVEQATSIFRQVVATKPRALLQQGDAAGAVENLELARKLFPGREATYFQLSQAYRRLGRTAEAQQALATYQKLIESNRLKRRESLEVEKP